MRPNWFVALPVPPLDWFDRLVPPPPEGCRRFHRDDLHLTIAFLGAVGEDAARAGLAALRWPLGLQQVSLGAVVPMGSKHRFSALSALLVEGREAIESAMQAARGPVWQAAGAEPDDRPAKAHFTLARPRRSATRAEREAALRWAQALDLQGTRICLDRVALYTWTADRRERQFRVVETPSSS